MVRSKRSVLWFDTNRILSVGVDRESHEHHTNLYRQPYSGKSPLESVCDTNPEVRLKAPHELLDRSWFRHGPIPYSA